MQDADRDEFARVLSGLAAIKRCDLTVEAWELWWNSMADWSIENFRAAASHLVRTCEWMPTPFHFTQLMRAGEMTSDEAWGLVLSGADLIPHSRAWRVARILGGQQHIRRSHVRDELPFLARRFKEAYNELRDADEVREAMPQLMLSAPAADSVVRLINDQKLLR